MYRKIVVTVALTADIFLAGCGTSSEGPGGSKAQTRSGVNENGYPGGKPTDVHSPALGSSSEQAHSRDQDAEKKAEGKGEK